MCNMYMQYSFPATFCLQYSLQLNNGITNNWFNFVYFVCVEF